MTGVFSAWLAAVALVAWRRGLGNRDSQGNSAPQWPPPYVFLNASVYMGIAALVARANGTVGGLFAWGSVLALLLASGQPGQPSPVEDFSAMVTALFGRQPSASALQSASGQQTPLTFGTGAGTFPGAPRFRGA